jgi:hypothetical protein
LRSPATSVIASAWSNDYSLIVPLAIASWS